MLLSRTEDLMLRGRVRLRRALMPGRAEPAARLCLSTERVLVGKQRLPSTGHERQGRRLFMAPGTVQGFNDSKGYGVITPEDMGKRRCVHHSALARDGYKPLAEAA